MIADEIPGYDYGSPTAAKSPITPKELEQLKQSAGFTQEDERWLRVAGDVLADQAKELVEKWRAVISAYPHLARCSQRPDGQKDPHYSEASGLRFQQWVPAGDCFAAHQHQKEQDRPRAVGADHSPARYCGVYGGDQRPEHY